MPINKNLIQEQNPCASSFQMACVVVAAAFRLPFAIRRLSDPAPRIRLYPSTIRSAHLRGITTASSMSQQSGETGAVVDASRNDENSAENPVDVVVQYVVLRRDLIDSWPLGSVVTQGCHASVAAIWSFKDDPFTHQYCDPQHIGSMHKVLRSTLFFEFLEAVD